MSDLPIILAVDDDQGPITGPVPNQGFTDDPSPVVRVSIAGTGAAAGDRLQLLGVFSAAPVGSAATITEADLAAGSVAIPLSGLPSGQYPLIVQLQSSAGALLATSGFPRVFNVALAAPATPYIRQVFDDGAGPWAPVTGGHTADATPVVQVFMPGVSEIPGPVSPGHPPFGDTNPIHGGAVLLYADGQLAGQGQIGSWGFEEFHANTLAPGPHTLAVAAEDRAGNLSPLSAPFVLTIDSPSSRALVAAGAALSLAPAAGWTDAAVLSNGALALVGAVDGGYGSHKAAEWSFTSGGALTAAAALRGYAPVGQTLAPQLTALDGGFYRAEFGGGDYAVYASDGREVFAHNAFTDPSGGFMALTNGGYLVTAPAAGVFGLFSPSGANLAWTALPAPGLSPTALEGGGFVLTGRGVFDLYDPAGTLIAAGNFGSSVSGFASAVTATSDGGFLAAWLSADGGTAGLASAITVQAFDAAGHAQGAPVIAAQDLDPWHTTFALQTHGDGGASVVWSQGGGVFGAEYADGSVSGAHAAVAGDLGAMRAITLSDGDVGLAWVSGGQVWAEIFDPAGGGVQRAVLGATTGGLDTLGVLATDDGGLAASWRAGGLVQAAVLPASGAPGPAMTIAGDLLGVDASGHALTVHDAGGAPVLQAYALDAGLFWAA